MGDFMEYAKQLPPFNPDVHLTGADLRRLEKEHGYEAMSQPDTDSAGKIQKASYEVGMMTEACLRFKQQSIDHPPYGLSAPLENPLELALISPAKVEGSFMTEEETAMALECLPLKGVQALSDLKLQLILNQLVVEAFPTPAFAQVLPAARTYAQTVTGGQIDSWKLIMQSAASNAKRSEFIVLKHIVIQWMKQVGRLPTREEFTEVVSHSEPLLETLATTHQEVFRVLNAPLILDERRQQFHRLVNKDGKGQLAIDKSILDLPLKFNVSQPKVRTMCAALLAKDADGVSLLEHSYREDAAMVTEMLFDGDTPRAERFESIPNERLPQQSVHMYLRLRKQETQ